MKDLLLKSALSPRMKQQPNALILELLKGAGVEHTVHGSGQVSINLGGAVMYFEQDGQIGYISPCDDEQAA